MQTPTKMVVPQVAELAKEFMQKVHYKFNTEVAGRFVRYEGDDGERVESGGEFGGGGLDADTLIRFFPLGGYELAGLGLLAHHHHHLSTNANQLLEPTR
jgi:hypothetical protein